MAKSSDKAYARDYKSRVLRPYFRQIHLSDFVDVCQCLEQSDSSRLHDLDLITLYDIGASMNRVEIEKRVSVIHHIWSNLKLELSQYVGPLQRLEKWLKAQRQVSSIAFWNELRRERQNRATSTMRDSGELERQFGAYGVVTEDAVRATITLLGLSEDDFSDDDIHQCAADANLTIAEAITVPDIELDVNTMTVCLEKAHRRTLPHAIFDDIVGNGQSQSRFKIVDRFQILNANGEDSKTQLTLAAVARARDSARQERQDTGEHREAVLSALRATNDHELHAIVLKHLLDHVIRQAPRVPSRIMGYLESLGLAHDDAQRIAVHVHMHRNLSRRSHTDSIEGFVQQIRQSILDKDLDQANHLHQHAMSTTAKKGSSDTSQRQLKDLGDQLAGLSQRYARQREAGLKAVEVRDFISARVDIRAALAINEDEELRNVFRALPPSPPNIRGVIACENAQGELGQALRIVWESGTEASLDSRYRLICKQDAQPLGANDGQVIAEQLNRSDFVDDTPPIARHFWYGISTYQEVSGPGVDSQTLFSSAAIHGPIFFCPPVTGLSATTDESSIRLTWTAPRRCTAVRIAVSTPGDKTVFHEFAKDSHTFTDLELLTEYSFDATALFRTNDGRIYESEPVALDVLVRPPMLPITDFDIDIRRNRDQLPHLIARLPSQNHYSIGLWSFQQPSPYRIGQQVSIEELEDLSASTGYQLRGSIQPDGDVSVMDTTIGFGVSYLQAFTLRERFALGGCVKILAVSERIDSVSFEQLGDVLKISWPWPASIDRVQVEWQWSGGQLHENTIVASHRSIADNLLQVPMETGSLKLRLRGVYSLPEQCSTTSPSLVRSHHDSEWFDAIWESRVSVASYCLGWYPIRSRRSRQCTLTYYSESERVIDTEVIIVASARYEPTIAEGHQELSRHRLVLSARGDRVRVKISIPRRLNVKWIRAFPVDNASVRLKPKSRTQRCRVSTLLRRPPT